MGFIAGAEHNKHFHLFGVSFDTSVSLSFVIGGASSLTVRTKITYRDVFTKFVPIDRTLIRHYLVWEFQPALQGYR